MKNQKTPTNNQNDIDNLVYAGLLFRFIGTETVEIIVQGPDQNTVIYTAQAGEQRSPTAWRERIQMGHGKSAKHFRNAAQSTCLWILESLMDVPELQAYL